MTARQIATKLVAKGRAASDPKRGVTPLPLPQLPVSPPTSPPLPPEQVRTLPKVLKYLPSDKAQDARNYVNSLQYWLGGNDGECGVLPCHVGRDMPLAQGSGLPERHCLEESCHPFASTGADEPVGPPGRPLVTALPTSWCSPPPPCREPGEPDPQHRPVLLPGLQGHRLCAGRAGAVPRRGPVAPAGAQHV